MVATMSKARAKGSMFETEVTFYLNNNGQEHAHRNPLNSPLGDIGGTPMTIEAKNHKEMALGTWMKQAEESSILTSRPPVVVHKRRGKNVSQAYVTMTLETFAELLKHLT
jgi:hypothetical protein